MTAIMMKIALTLLVAIIIAMLIQVAKWAGNLGDRVRRYNDKQYIKAAMAREAYLNDLYEESLYEEADRLARKTAKQMVRNR